MIQIQNNDAEIVYTNYWDSQHAARGFFFLSINVGTFRLLVPDSMISEIAEWKRAEEVIISRGPWPEKMKADAIEILFEDYSDSPYAIHMLSDQVDRMPADTDRDRKGQPPRWKFSAWTSNGKVLDFPCRYRIVKKIPCLKAWPSL